MSKHQKCSFWQLPTLTLLRLGKLCCRSSIIGPFGAVLLSSDALAAGFAIRENNAVSLAMAAAGDGSRAEAASTVYANPAGMTEIQGSEIEAGVVIIAPSIKFEGNSSVFNSPVPGNSGGNAGKLVGVPNMFWTFELGNKLKGGIAVTAPFGMGSEYDSGWSGRYLGVKTDALSVDINPSIAFRLTNSLSFGAGLSAQYFKLETSSAIPQFIIAGPTEPDAKFNVKADDWSLGFNVGLLLKVSDVTRVGVTHRSKTDHDLKGSVSFDGLNAGLSLANSEASAELHLPSVTGVSLTHEFNPQVSISAEAQFSRWSVFDRIIVESQNPLFVLEQRFQDSWMLAIGVVYHLNNKWTLRSGAAWDQTPVSDQYRSVNLPDEDRYVLGAGFGYWFTEAVSVDAAYQYASHAKRATMSSSFNAIDPFLHLVTLAGKYDVAVNSFAVSLRVKI